MRELRIAPICFIRSLGTNQCDSRPGQKTAQKNNTDICGHCFLSLRREMAVPSNSPKYVCQNCRHKIGTNDLEKIFQEQVKVFSCSLPEANETETASPSKSKQNFIVGFLAASQQR
jgi:hypothetical protein